MPAQIGYFDTLKSVAGKVFTYLASITLTGTDGKTITVTADTSLDEAVAMSSKATVTKGAWTPALASSAGTITTLGAVTGTYTKLDRMVTLIFTALITTNGTGSGYIKVTGMPFNVTTAGFGAGIEMNVSGKDLSYRRLSDTELICKFYDNTYPGADGAIIQGVFIYFV